LHEGVNLAMASGVLAAETILAARDKKDFSSGMLAGYQKRLEQSFVIKDLKNAKNFIPFVSTHPQLLQKYPLLVNGILAEYFGISEQPKAEIKKRIFRKIRQEVGLGRITVDMVGILRNLI
jgi:electron transfer flavoprotein-quinone oxidoreductase